jgi:hypothetical protein
MQGTLAETPADCYVPHFREAARGDLIVWQMLLYYWEKTRSVGVRFTNHEAVHIKNTKFRFRPLTGQVKIAVPRLNVRGFRSNDTGWQYIRIFSDALYGLRNFTAEWNGEMEWRLE